MSLSDITQLLGTGSVPVVVAGTVLGVFELGDRLASQRAKDALSKWLVSFDVQKAKALPDGTRELFARIFGERHFSLNCFIRSAAFSLGAIVFLGILVLLIDPNAMFSNVAHTVSNPVAALIFILWLPWSIIIDYFSLFKTRIILRLITRLQTKITVLPSIIVTIDFVVYRVLFIVGVASVTFLTGYMFGVSISASTFVEQMQRSPLVSSEIWDSSEDTTGFILFWSGFAPSLWMWLYVLALFVTRGLLRSERVVNWLRWALDVEKTPFRQIGAVAAALAFIASVAIILVSAEVSRISAAA